MTDKQLLIDKIERARNEVVSAESDLERLLGALEAVPRAQKTAVSQVVEEAFKKLRAAKTDLVDLQTLVTSTPD